MSATPPAQKPLHNLKEDDSIDLREILETIWGLRLWIVLSVILCVGIAYTYVKYTTPVYESTAGLLLVNDGARGGSTGSDMYFISELTGHSMRYKMSNELYMLQTISLLQQVVEDLNLNVQYFKKTRLKQQELYRNCPIAFQWENPVPVAWEGMKPLEITLKVKPGSDHFEINNMLVGGEQVYVKNKAVQFGEVISTPAGLFSITNLYSPTEDTGSTLFTIKVSSPRSFANKIKRNLTARQISDGRTNATTMANMSDIIVLTLQDEIKERAVRILHSLIQNYIQDNKEFSAQSIEKSIVFINDRLSQIERDLGIIETDYSSYRSVRRIVREDSQSQIAITSDAR